MLLLFFADGQTSCPQQLDRSTEASLRRRHSNRTVIQNRNEETLDVVIQRADRVLVVHLVSAGILPRERCCQPAFGPLQLGYHLRYALCTSRVLVSTPCRCCLAHSQSFSKNSEDEHLGSVGWHFWVYWSVFCLPSWYQSSTSTSNMLIRWKRKEVGCHLSRGCCPLSSVEFFYRGCVV